MDEQTQKVFIAIQEKDINDLTEHDKAFLRARRDYLGRNGRKKYAHILGEEPVQPQSEGNTEEETENDNAGDPFTMTDSDDEPDEV